jgi:hypothetical protein
VLPLYVKYNPKLEIKHPQKIHYPWIQLATPTSSYLQAPICHSVTTFLKPIPIPLLPLWQKLTPNHTLCRHLPWAINIPHPQLNHYRSWLLWPLYLFPRIPILLFFACCQSALPFCLSTTHHLCYPIACQGLALSFSN